jgi:hypothetical protein
VGERSPGHHAYVGYRDVTGKPATLPELTHSVGRIEQKTLLRLIAGVNNVLIQRGEPTARSQVALVRQFLSLDLATQLNRSAWGRRPELITVFHRQQQLYLLTHAVRCARPGLGKEWSDETCHLFGHSCLMASDLVGAAGQVVAGADPNVALLSTLLPLTELPADLEPFPTLGRAYRLWTESPNVPALAQQHDRVDYHRSFLQAYGVSLADFLDVLIGLFVHCYHFDPNNPLTGERLYVRRGVISQNSAIPDAVWDRVLGMISITPEDLALRLETQPRQNATCDFSLLRAYPLLQVAPDEYICYDLGFLLKTITDGIYWRIHDALDGNERGAFRSYFGEVFAWHVTTAFERMYRPSRLLVPRFFPAPLFAEGGKEEVADGLLDFGDLILLIEIKGSLLPTRAKYSGDARLLDQELRTRFVESRKGEGKGVGQLAKNIARLASGQRMAIAGVDVRSARTIIPVLVVYDTGLTTSLAHLYLDAALRSRLGDLPIDFPRVGRLAILSTHDVECLEGLRRKRSLREVFVGYDDAQPRWRSFWDYLRSHHASELSTDDTLTRESFEALFAQAAARHFPKTDEDAEPPPVA